MIHMKTKSIAIKVRLIIKRGNKFLLCKDKKNTHYFLPGGSVEYGDSFEKTIYKEMDEELGLKSEQIMGIFYKDHLEHIYVVDNKEYHELNMIFTAEIPNDIITVSQEDHIDFEWIDTKDIKNIKLLPEKIVPFLFSLN